MMMNIGYLNGNYLPKVEIKISPDDRGFLFADGVYEVVRWYQGDFFDMEGHLTRLKRSLREIKISWPEADIFPEISLQLINRNSLEDKPALVYIQVTRGAVPRAHAFPSPPVTPTVYAFAKEFDPAPEKVAAGIGVIMKKDIRWSRCDVKSVALLPNVLSIQEAVESGNGECIFVRDGFITECSHSNVFFVFDNVLYTHPESENILSGISRKNIIRIAKNAGIEVREVAVSEKDIEKADEVFISNTSSEAGPVISVNGKKVGNGKPGPVTLKLRSLFNEETARLRKF
jgi:D-alanine transaminase